MKELKATYRSWKILVCSILCSILMVLALPVAAQSRQNIAGNYRGLLTGCLTAAQPNACRKGLAELVRLADEVDARRAEWELSAGGKDRALADRTHNDHAAALDSLNRGVVDFNRDMKSAAAGAR